MARISELFNLQKVDYNALKIRQEFQKVQKSLNGNEAINAAKAQYQTSKAKLDKLQAEQKDSELEIQSLSTRIEETDSQLMSGSVTNHKELESLQASLDSLKRQKETAETRSVETLVQVEALDAELTKLKADFETLKADWVDKASHLQEQGKKLQEQFGLLKKKRESLVSTLDKDSLTLYEQLRKRKGGVAVAQLKGDTCGACNMQVPSGIISASRVADTEPVYCPSCGRILFGNN